MKIYQFPTFRIENQLFHTPGAGYDGGLTSGGAQFITPEPGGFGVLEMQPAIIDTEWDAPLASWIMSKISGQVFRARLAPSPQVAYSRKRGMLALPWDNGETWSNQENWDGDFTAVYTAPALRGSLVVEFDLTGVGQIVSPGHVIGHDYDCYLVDEVIYSGDIAAATVTTPLCRDIAPGDNCYLRPWFTGRISNGADIRSAYNSLGHVKPGNIILQQAIV
ncbi:hypothetical protein [Sphingopyxis macrogoltabida]|uniref:Uncharacterized protein n=1 Tax=Sphingopyxis macrogoltabida TaxID=33050 RepID=A0AAC8Z113_SPHMC|nr:hypothetical protein [Sphingopyxis macrogoltabida]ALJ12646.1 hypothetical protein LH19_07180 [Sphingopyxis macrogoltabida]AMU89886.1 hypothetical protein ATM17_12655 [Sphingopyxis macrogoltabida]